VFARETNRSTIGQINKSQYIAEQSAGQTTAYPLVVRQRINSRLYIIGMFNKFQEVGAEGLVCLSRLAELL